MPGVAGHSEQGKLLLREEEIPSIEAAPESFNNVLTFVDDRSSELGGRNIWRLVLGKEKAVLYCASLGEVWPVSKNEINVKLDRSGHMKELRVELADGRCQTFKESFGGDVIAIRAWMATSFTQYQEFELQALRDCPRSWGILIWILSEKKDPHTWLTWRLPYENVEQALQLLVSNPEDYNALVDRIATSIPWKVLENLTPCDTDVQRRFARDLHERMKKEYAPSSIGCLITAWVYLVPFALAIGYGVFLLIKSLSVQGEFQAGEMRFDGVGIAFLGALLASPAVLVLLGAWHKRKNRARLAERARQLGIASGESA